MSYNMYILQHVHSATTASVEYVCLIVHTPYAIHTAFTTTQTECFT